MIVIYYSCNFAGIDDDKMIAAKKRKIVVMIYL
jgi:hypothetical protein